MARILLLDDDIAEISSVKRVLARSGHQPVLATNASDATAMIGQARPDLLVVGATCESGEALALARRLAEESPPLRIVVLGTSPDAPAGVPQVPRPVDPGQLADEVARAVAASAPGAGGPPAPAQRRPAPPGGAPAGAARARAATASPSASPTQTARPATPARPPAPAADPGAARRAAVEALRARADELRRGGPEAPPASAPAPAAPEDDGLEALLRRAEEAERRSAAERKARARQADRATVEAAQRAEAERVAVQKAAHAREAEARIRVEEKARAEAEQRRREETARAAEAEQRRRVEEGRRAEAARRAREAEARARAEAEARQRAEDERLAAAEAARRADEERRTAADAARRAEEERRTEAARRAAAERERETAQRERKVAEQEREAAELERRAAAEAARRTEEDARRAAEAEARRVREAEDKAAAEAAARKALEGELESLRQRLEAERRTAEAQLQSVVERAAAEGQAAEELRRLEEEARARAEEEARRRAEEEEALRRAIESARAEMEALRKRSEEEARRRSEAEAEVRRLAEEAARRLAAPPAFDFPAYAPPIIEAGEAGLAPDAYARRELAAEEAARRRVAALRADADLPAPAAPPRAPAPGEPLAPPAPELRSGGLSEVTAPRLFALADRARLGGRLDFQGEGARSVYFEEGRVVGATSADPADRIEELALRLGLVTRDQHRQIAGAAGALPSRRAALLLLERGFLKPTELTALVRRRTEEVVFGVFADPAARFRWAAEDVPPEERITLDRGTLALAVEGVRRRWLAPSVDAVLGGAGTLLAPTQDGPAYDELGLAPAERRALALADGLRTVDELVAASPLDPLSTRQVLAALVLVGALGVRVLQAGRPAAVATAGIDLARVREKHDQARRADYFTILGVGRRCTPHEVREAAVRLSAEFDPARFQAFRDDALRGQLEEILRVVADAREVLANDALRGEYLGALGD